MNVYCVRANYGLYAERFRNGSYVGIGWLEGVDLSEVADLDEVRDFYEKHNPDVKSNYVRGNHAGQIARFLFDIQAGDYVITPSRETEKLYWGIVGDGGYYFEPEPADGCPYNHRRPVKWEPEAVIRQELSVPLQNTLRALLAVYRIANTRSFFEAIGREDLVPPKERAVQQSMVDVVLDRVLELDDEEFEILVTELLNAMGFDSEHTGKVGDGGVDAIGDLNLSNIARIRLYVQAKRYQKQAKINANTVKALRQNIPAGAQGAFITTAQFPKRALEIATEPGFPRIGTIDGEQLVDLLVERWEALPETIREKLGLRRGLVLP